MVEIESFELNSTKIFAENRAKLFKNWLESGRNGQVGTNCLLFDGFKGSFENFFLIVLIFLIQIDVFSAHVFVTRLKQTLIGMDHKSTPIISQIDTYLFFIRLKFSHQGHFSQFKNVHKLPSTGPTTVMFHVKFHFKPRSKGVVRLETINYIPLGQERLKYGSSEVQNKEIFKMLFWNFVKKISENVKGHMSDQ